MAVVNEDAGLCCSENSGSGVADYNPEDVRAGMFDEVVADDEMSPLTTENHFAEDIAGLIDLMEERRVAGKSILIEPADLLTKEAQATAECSLSLVDIQEYVELKSFIDAKLERKLQSMPVNSVSFDIPYKVRVATEQREHYYYWMM